MQVILGSDGSIEADIASAVLKKIPLPKDVQITVAMATAPAASIGMALAPEQSVDAYGLASDSWKIQHQIAEQTAGSLSERLAESGYNSTPRVLEGEAGTELMALAKNLHAELIAIGSGANNRLSAFMLGSVARKLLFYADSSILVGRKMENAGEEGTYSRLRRKDKIDVLLAYDGSAGSELAVQTLATLERKAFAKITVLIVNERLPEMFGLEGLEEESADDELMRIANLARDRIEHAADIVDVKKCGGPPSQSIDNWAKKLDVDLIMMGANRHGIMERLIVGSCAYETMLSSPCSVLVIRQPLQFE